MIVLASDGIAAEWQGENLGQYRLSGEVNKSPYYVQSSNLSHCDSRPLYLYRTEDNQWWVNDVLGERAGFLKNPQPVFQRQDGRCLMVVVTGLMTPG